MTAICAAGLHLVTFSSDEPDHSIVSSWSFSKDIKCLQIVSGRHRQETCALHHLTGVAVEYANLWRGSRMSMKSVVKGVRLSGVP